MFIYNLFIMRDKDAIQRRKEEKAHRKMLRKTEKQARRVADET